MSATRYVRFTILFFVAIIIVLAGCRTDEERVRAIVKEELSAGLKRTIVTDAHTVGPYSPAQQIGGFLFVSGQIGLNQQTGILEDASFEGEARQALENLRMVLRKSGYDSSNVVQSTVFLTDIANYGVMNALYGGYFQEGTYPARTTVQVVALPRNARIEIAAIAYKPLQGTL